MRIESESTAEESIEDVTEKIKHDIQLALEFGKNKAPTIGEMLSESHPNDPEKRDFAEFRKKVLLKNELLGGAKALDVQFFRVFCEKFIPEEEISKLLCVELGTWKKYQGPGIPRIKSKLIFESIGKANSWTSQTLYAVYLLSKNYYIEQYKQKASQNANVDFLFSLGMENYIARLLAETPGAVYIAEFLWEDRTSPRSSRQPYLYDPSDEQREIYDYRRQSLHIYGRMQEQLYLEGFLADKRKFLWLQIAGVAGQGKSRLALDLMHKAKNHGWKAGFVECDEIAKFVDQYGNDWEPNQPYLIIVDYIFGEEEKLKGLFRLLCRNDKENILECRVRILILERQRWDQGYQPTDNSHNIHSNQVSSNSGNSYLQSQALWFLQLVSAGDVNELKRYHFGDCPLELRKVEPAQLVKIVIEVANAYANEESKPKPTLPTSAEIQTALAHIDRDGRPLYAYFLGVVLSDGKEKIVTFTAEKLLYAFFDRELQKKWQKAFNGSIPFPDSGDPALGLALLATITGGVDRKKPPVAYECACADPHTLKRALVISGGNIGRSAKGIGDWVPPIQPDLFGEWVVIHYLNLGFPLDLLIEQAWQYEPRNTTKFILRVTQDFPYHNITSGLISHNFPLHSNCAMQALSVEAPAILQRLVNSGKFFFPPVMKEALRISNRFFDWDQNYDIARLDESIIVLESVEKGRFDFITSKAPVLCAYIVSIGPDGEVDGDKLINILVQSAEQGNIHAMTTLGVIYFVGFKIDKAFQKAVYWFNKAAANDDPDSMQMLGYMYIDGIGVEKDVDTGVKWYRRAADLGIADARAKLGNIYYYGYGLPQNYAEAAKWHRLAADQGHADAQYKLGVMYYSGNGVSQNYEAAAKWHRLAADQGHADAQYNLGVMYASGIGVKEDIKYAIECYEKAAAQDDANAMCNLGHIYATGKAGTQKFDKAKDWYEKAQQRNHPEAMFNLGHMYFFGQGVEKNPKQAARLFNMSAKLGHAAAAFFLGYMYAKGEDVAWDLKKAKHWLNKASNSGISIAHYLLQNLNNRKVIDKIVFSPLLL